MSDGIYKEEGGVMDYSEATVSQERGSTFPGWGGGWGENNTRGNIQ